MAYTELIKSFERIRNYMREFYVYGFKSREELAMKSARSYDNERRRIESYIGDYMAFRQTPSGKNIFISIDSRTTTHNPLYKALKAKSFTDGDITFHFIIFDILHSPNITLSLNEIIERIDNEYLACFREPMIFDKSTVRKKLKEYEELGLITSNKEGRLMTYRRTNCFLDSLSQGFKLEPSAPSKEENNSNLIDAINYFSEVSLCGIIGSYILGKLPEGETPFSFKHHYITQALESEALYKLLLAISDRRSITLVNYRRGGSKNKDCCLIPLKIFISVQSGRRYLIGYHIKDNNIRAYRLDYITEVKLGEAIEEKSFMELRELLQERQKHMWGVSSLKNNKLEKVEFTIYISEKEGHIYRRIEREKRCGKLEWVDANHLKFTCEVYDSNEMLPWIRTFICRITSISFSNKLIEAKFKSDLEKMYSIYGLGGEGNSDIS
ncbi:WYL domain-containing protein [Alloiococcus sp. CFN-8]|uniref:helix-turn-helix transcriptional regulator n=1 Tax=Alloiococcus sp. CFN-8 TaxID=3416081 RepID=UPI003CED4781